MSEWGRYLAESGWSAAPMVSIITSGSSPTASGARASGARASGAKAAVHSPMQRGIDAASLSEPDAGIVYISAVCYRR